jgi:preprotein translocase subunit SecG
MLYYFAATIYVLVCLVLMLVILLQQGKGGDIANAFGGGTSQAAFGARSGATVLSRATTVAAVLFILGALALGIIGQRGPGSVVGGRVPQQQQPRPAAQPPAPTQQQSAPAPAPAAPAPAPQQPTPAPQQPTPAP